MSDFSKQRLNMVDNQVRPSDVTDRALISAMLDIPREMFVPSSERSLAYVDRDIRIGTDKKGDRYLLAPAGLARLIQALELDENAVVLDVGCGTGYSSAVLSRLAGSIVAVEQDPDMIRTAEENLSSFDIDNVAVVEGQLTQGFASEGPYDGILIAGGIQVLPSEITDQLAENGRLVVVEYGGGPGRAMLYERSGQTIAKRPLFDLDASLLPDFLKKPEFQF